MGKASRKKRRDRPKGHPTLDLIARLVREKKLIRNDGPHENHYPSIRNDFVRKVKERT